MSKEIEFHLPDVSSLPGELGANFNHLRAVVDLNKFSKVLRNLASNAIKFTPKHGRVSVTINLTKTTTLPTEWQSKDRVWKYAQARHEMARAVADAGLQLYGYLRINVTDTGVGLSPVRFSPLLPSLQPSHRRTATDSSWRSFKSNPTRTRAAKARGWGSTVSGSPSSSSHHSLSHSLC
jgi:hypothetical protein